MSGGTPVGWIREVVLAEDLAAAHDRAISVGATLTGEHISPRPGPDGEPVPWRTGRVLCTFSKFGIYRLHMSLDRHVRGGANADQSEICL